MAEDANSLPRQWPDPGYCETMAEGLRQIAQSGHLTGKHMAFNGEIRAMKNVVSAAANIFERLSAPSPHRQAGGGKQHVERPELPSGDPIKGRPDAQRSDGGQG